MSDEDVSVPPAAVDPRPRQLLEKYASLTGTFVLGMAEDLLAFDVPPAETHHWGGRDRVLVALVPEALDEDPEAAVLAIGSPLFTALIGAIRVRGFREVRGLIQPTESPSPEAALLPARLDGASVETVKTELTLLPVGRLLARVSIKAGARLEERLIESPVVDLTSGTPVSGQLVEFWETTTTADTGLVPADTRVAKPQGPRELLPLLFGHMEGALAGELSRLREDADRNLRIEVERLERYYAAMLQDVEPEEDPDAARTKKQAIQAELERRKSEEVERSQVRVTVHPLQLTERQVLAQRASWRIVTPAGRAAEVYATRVLTGATEWLFTCPSCGQKPEVMRVCREGHGVCPACSQVCTICGEAACQAHGALTCGSGPHPVCGDHARTCGSCGKAHCSTHSVTCVATAHEVCPECSVLCARCGVGLCQAHATHTAGESPRGARWLCAGCTVLCEAGQNEPIGLDEAVRCSACERYICETHRVNCAVDGQPHCSRHLRRSDRSGRLVCESHRAACGDEPGSILASDEVAPCATCGKSICEAHGAACEADGARHCFGHLAPLADRRGAKGCEQHRTVCHIDKVSFSITGTKPCPVCSRSACEAHRGACRNCARQVCVRDLEQDLCTTCRNLEETADPADDLIQAAVAANGGEPSSAKRWRTARDSSGTVVELDQGWRRKLVFSVLHGETKPRTAVQHTLLGAKRLR